MSNNPSTIARGNIANHWVLSLALSPALVAPNTSAEQTFTIKGLHLGDYVAVSKPTNQAGLAITNTRVSADNTLAISFGNLTAASITPTAAEIYTVHVGRAENLTGSASALSACN